MNGIIAFNSSNDVVFDQLNALLRDKVHSIAVDQGLLTKEDNVTQVDENIILQIFSPLIMSQRIMHAQFDNTYTSLRCENGLNFSFGEFLGHTFIKIGQHPVEQLKRHLGVAIAVTRHLYGANLFATQAHSVQEEILRMCLKCYEEHLWNVEQGMTLEALPRLLINAELKRSVRNTLNAAIDRLKELGNLRTHVVMFVTNKFVGMASSKQALAMSPSDLLFLALLNRSLQRAGKRFNQTSVAVFLQGALHDPHSGCVPCIAHLAQLDKDVVLVQVVEYANLPVASSMYDTFFVLQRIIATQVQGDVDGLKPTFESLETFVKQTLDALKRAKLKSAEVDTAVKKFSVKWDNLRKMYVEFLKGYERELLVRIESNVPAFNEELKHLFTLTCCDSSAVVLDQLPEVSSVVERKLAEYVELLAVKAQRDVSLEAYMEDFPGMVHFVYVNRSQGLMIAPDMRPNQMLTTERLCAMVDFARGYLKTGKSAVMWTDFTFHYSYFLWFEDQSSGAPKSVDLQEHFVASSAAAGSAFKPQYEPGLLACDYYQQLAEVCFPKAAPGKIKCYELFCVHLCLVTATLAAEHSRRLVATIADVVGDDCL